MTLARNAEDRLIVCVITTPTGRRRRCVRTGAPWLRAFFSRNTLGQSRGTKVLRFRRRAYTPPASAGPERHFGTINHDLGMIAVAGANPSRANGWVVYSTQGGPRTYVEIRRTTTSRGRRDRPADVHHPPRHALPLPAVISRIRQCMSAVRSQSDGTRSAMRTLRTVVENETLACEHGSQRPCGLS